MSLTDPIILCFDPEYDEPWHLIRGRETFYDRETDDPKLKDRQRRWQNPHDAVAWAKSEHGVDHVINEDMIEHLEGMYIANDEMRAKMEQAEKDAREAKRDYRDRPVQFTMGLDE